MLSESYGHLGTGTGQGWESATGVYDSTISVALGTQNLGAVSSDCAA